MSLASLGSNNNELVGDESERVVGDGRWAQKNPQRARGGARRRGVRAGNPALVAVHDSPVELLRFAYRLGMGLVAERKPSTMIAVGGNRGLIPPNV